MKMRSSEAENLNTTEVLPRSYSLSPETRAAIERAKKARSAGSKKSRERVYESKERIALKSNVNKIKKQNVENVKVARQNIGESSHKLKDNFKKATRVAKNDANSGIHKIKAAFAKGRESFRASKFYAFAGPVLRLFGKVLKFIFALIVQLSKFLVKKLKSLGQSIINVKSWSGFAKRACVACVIGAFFAFYLYAPAQEFYCQSREKARLDAQLEVIKDTNEDIKQEIDKLSTDTGVEDYARSNFGWVKNGESGIQITGLPQEQNVNANLKNQEYKAPSTWYSGLLDGLFCYKQGE